MSEARTSRFHSGPVGALKCRASPGEAQLHRARTGALHPRGDRSLWSASLAALLRHQSGSVFTTIAGSGASHWEQRHQRCRGDGSSNRIESHGPAVAHGGNVLQR